jgi:hypothetical protein
MIPFKKTKRLVRNEEKDRRKNGKSQTISTPEARKIEACPRLYNHSGLGIFT